MIAKILNKIRGNYFGYKLGRKALSIKSVVNNPLYSRTYQRKIDKTIKKLDQSFPLGVDIGVTNACNSDCIMCPHSRLKNIGTMKMDLYEKIIDNCARLKIKNVILSFFGEPLLDKTLLNKIAYAKQKGLDVAFYSNGSLLDKRWAHDLIDVGLDSITISFDGYSKETYEKIRRGLKFDVLKANILGLIDAKKDLKKENPKINLVLVEQTDNKKEIKKFYNEWKEKVESINIINLRNWAGEVDDKFGSSFHSKKGLKRTPCSLIWQKLVVDWNGDAVLCCDDWNHSMVLGNLKTESIEEIWRGKKLTKIRKLHKEGKFEKIPLCSNCNKKSIWWFIK